MDFREVSLHVAGGRTPTILPMQRCDNVKNAKIPWKVDPISLTAPFSQASLLGSF